MQTLIGTIAENMSDGGIKLLKTMGIIIAAAVLLYVVLVLVRVLGGKLERKSYDRYVKKCQDNDTQPIEYEEYFKRRAEGQRVLWKREETNAEAQVNGTIEAQDVTTEERNSSADIPQDDFASQANDLADEHSNVSVDNEEKETDATLPPLDNKDQQ